MKPLKVIDKLIMKPLIQVISGRDKAERKKLADDAIAEGKFIGPIYGAKVYFNLDTKTVLIRDASKKDVKRAKNYYIFSYRAPYSFLPSKFVTDKIMIIRR